MLPEIPEAAIWAIFLLPLFSFVVISFVLRPFLNRRPQLSGYVAIGAIAGAFMLSLWALASVIEAPGHELSLGPTTWVEVGETTIELRLIMDSLTAIMVVVVSSVSLLVQVYSQGYMHGDGGYPRYFAFMSLFTASMLGLVLAANLLMLYVFWELVGLCSYLLIGFWFHRPAAAAAAKKAFIVTRIGDFGFLIAILLLYSKTGTFDINALFLDENLAILTRAAFVGVPVLTWAAIGVFCGAVGKSAQFPLHVWLPDAMEGPTPVSALIHAATMVAAGVYLVARLLPLFVHSETALTTVAVIGGFTAIFAASMGLVMNDIKRVLAYSTISQLGYMMLGLGAAGLAVAGGGEEAVEIGIAVGIFHLFNHAFFKALLFLGAGSVSHATGTFDMREMGGLRRIMPWTFATFLIASLSIAGIWPLAGFWSKEPILDYSLHHAPVLFVLAMITVFMTAFYMFRALFLTFGGEYRGSRAAGHESHAHGGEGPALHESPPVMLIPMVLLAIMAVVSGWFPVSHFLGGEHEASFLGALFEPLALVSLAMAGSGIVLAYAMYSTRRISAESIGATFSPFYKAFSRKYWFDELYERVFVVRVLVNGGFAVLQWLDTYIIDGAVNGIAGATINGGRVIRRLQTGQLQAYGLAIFFGVLAIMLCVFIFGS